MPCDSRYPSPIADFTAPVMAVPASVMPICRIIRLMGKQPVGVDRTMDVGSLERNFHVKADVFQSMHGIERGFGEGFG